MNRETWLNNAVIELKESIFAPLGYEIPQVKVSIGFTGSKSKKAIGACWNSLASSDNIAQIYIVPTIDDSSRVLDILAHELIHALYPLDGHKGNFPKCAKKIGLTGKMTATIASPELKVQLDAIVLKLGVIPHAKLNSELGAKKKQGTRLLKLSCSCCDYIVRTSQKCVDMGLPTCPCGNTLELE